MLYKIPFVFSVELGHVSTYLDISLKSEFQVYMFPSYSTCTLLIHIYLYINIMFVTLYSVCDLHPT